MIGTVSLLSQPDQFAPLNSGEQATHLWYEVFSGSYSETSFHYLFDVYSYNQTTLATNSLGRYLIPPRPDGGEGLFTPYKILNSQINLSPLEWLPQINGPDAVLESIVEYNVAYGFQVNPNLTFSTRGQAGRLVLTIFPIDGNANPNLFTPGDIITIDMQDKAINPQYNTTASVILTTYDAFKFEVTTDIALGITYSGEVGTIINQVHVQGISATAWGWDATRQYGDMRDYGSIYPISIVSVSPFLTTYTNDPATSIKPTRLGTYETMGFLYKGEQFPASSYVLTSYDYSGNVLQKATFSASGLTNSYRKYEIGVGPNNMIGGSLTMNDTVAKYSVEIIQGSTTRARIWRRIDNTCTIYDDVQLSWLNPLGSYEYWNFTQDSKRNSNISRTEFKKTLPWNYTTGMRGQSVLSSDIQITYDINSNWVSEYDYGFIETLFESPEVYLISGTTRYPIIITSNTYYKKTIYRDQLFNIQISYKFAYPQIVQNQ